MMRHKKFITLRAAKFQKPMNTPSLVKTGHPKGLYASFRHRDVGTLQLLWNACHLRSIPDKSDALQWTKTCFKYLWKLYWAGLSHPLSEVTLADGFGETGEVFLSEG